MISFNYVSKFKLKKIFWRGEGGKKWRGGGGLSNKFFLKGSKSKIKKV